MKDGITVLFLETRPGEPLRTVTYMNEEPPSDVGGAKIIGKYQHPMATPGEQRLLQFMQSTDGLVFGHATFFAHFLGQFAAGSWLNARDNLETEQGR